MGRARVFIHTHTHRIDANAQDDSKTIKIFNRYSHPSFSLPLNTPQAKCLWNLSEEMAFLVHAYYVCKFEFMPIFIHSPAFRWAGKRYRETQFNIDVRKTTTTNTLELDESNAKQKCKQQRIVMAKSSGMNWKKKLRMFSENAWNRFIWT